MASENYILEYYYLQTSYLKNNMLSFWVDGSVNSSYQQQIYNIVPNRQRKKQYAETVCRLHFLIDFLTKLGIHQIPNEVLLSAITKNTTQLAEYKELLRLGCFIDFDSAYNLHEVYDKKLKATRRESEPSVYNIPLAGFRLVKSSNRFLKKNCVQYTFNILDKGILSSIKNSLSTLREGGMDSIINTSVFENQCSTIARATKSENFTSFDPNTRVSQNQCSTITKHHFSSIFTSWYSELTYCKNYNVKTHQFQKAYCKFNKKDKRFYHPFHHLDKEYRKDVYFEGEHIIEKFDVHNCHYALLNALIKDECSIPQEEKDQFWKLSVEDGKLYESIAEFANSTRELIKTEGCAKYLDYRNESLEQLRRLDADPNAPKKKVNKCKYVIAVDKYFETVFPNVRKYIYSIKSKDYKSLHFMLNKIETSIMVYHIAYTLFTKYDIKALTLHDGIYVKESDAMKMDELQLSTEIMFKLELQSYEM